jgi:hypothetical protein
MDPRHGTQIFSVTDISIAEPDPKYFVVPTEFTIVDHRSKTGERAQRASSASQKSKETLLSISGSQFRPRDCR